MKLRDGSETDDARLDRLIDFDARSRKFGIAEVVPEPPKKPRSKTWRLNERNDQGPDGACVGFGVGHRLAAAPLELGRVDYDFSFALYREAQKLDPWAGEDYEGTSVLAGIKAAQARGHVAEYRWCFTLEDYIAALLTEGPVLVGTWWKSSMWTPDASGYLDTSGRNVGGHCYILRGVDMRNKRFVITNSWGPNWGKNGEAWIRWEDWERDLMPGGEGAVLYEKRIRRTRPPGGEASKTPGSLRTASGLPLGHWWIRGR